MMKFLEKCMLVLALCVLCRANASPPVPGDMCSITVSDAHMTAAFSPDVTHYTVIIRFPSVSFSLSYKPCDEDALVLVNNRTTIANVSQIRTRPGKIEGGVTVAAKSNGKVKKVYSLRVEVQGLSMSLSSLGIRCETGDEEFKEFPLTPKFAYNILDYYPTVPYGCRMLSVFAKDNVEDVEGEHPIMYLKQADRPKNGIADGTWCTPSLIEVGITSLKVDLSSSSQALSVPYHIHVNRSKAEISSNCPKNCSHHGRCIVGFPDRKTSICECADGFVGQYCATEIKRNVTHTPPAKEVVPHYKFPSKIWVALVIVAAVVFVERLYSCYRRSRLRKLDRIGFEMIPTSETAHELDVSIESDEEIGVFEIGDDIDEL